MSPLNRMVVSHRRFIGLVLLSSLLVVVLFAFFGDAERGWAAGAFVGSIAVVVRAWWDRRGHLWFWVTIATFALVHVPVVFLVDWQRLQLAGPAYMAIVIPDYSAMFGCLVLVEKVMQRARGRRSGAA